MFWSLINLTMGINGFAETKGVSGGTQDMSILLIRGGVDFVVRNGVLKISGESR